MQLSRPLLDRFHDLRVLVVGDALLDTFVECAPRKLCSERPVPVVWKQRQLDAPGGAANVAANLAALRARVTLAAVTGADATGDRLRALLTELGVATRSLIVDDSAETHHKTRILADGQYVVRVDEGRVPVPRRPLRSVLERELESANVAVLSDYGLGLLDDQRTVGLLAGRRRDLPLIVDAKDLTRFRRLQATAVKPNLEEAITVAGAPGPHDRLARRVQQATSAGIVVLTLGRTGAYLLDGGGRGELLPARAVQAASEVGAGDSFVAALALALGAGASPREATAVAMETAAIAVAKPYTAVVTWSELSRAAGGVTAEKRPREPGQAAPAELLDSLEERRGAGQKIVFTNGVFDLLHPGHVDLLREARRLGDTLVVAVNSDDCVRRLKGPGRPVLNQDERLSLLLALDSVDHAFLFETDTAAELVRRIRPDVYVKGGDYSDVDFPEARTAREVGARVVILPRVIPASTTAMIRRVRQVTDQAPAAEAG